MLSDFTSRVAALNAGNYVTNAFSAGFVRSDFAQQLADYGEPVRWWKCFRDMPFDDIGPNGEAVNSDGQMFIERNLTEGVRMYCHDVMRQTAEGESFQYEAGKLDFVCLPDEIELTNGDRVLLIDRRVVHRQSIETGNGSRVRLERDWALDLTVISGGAGTLEVEANGASYVNLSAQTGPVLIEFAFAPRYVFLDESDRNQPRGSDGVRLPQRGVLTLENHINGN